VSFRSFREITQLIARPTLGISALDDPIVSGGKLGFL
jgi:hypothetical protein